VGRSDSDLRTKDVVSLAQAVIAEPVDLETALVERAIAGEERALAALYQRHAAHIAGVVRRSLGRDSEVDDIVQETFVQGLSQLPSLRQPAQLRSFLVTIAVRRVYARLSLRYRLAALSAQLFRITPSVSQPELTEPVQQLSDVLDRVPVQHRVAWVLHRVEGYTLPEVAHHTATSLTTVKRWIAKVDERLEAIDAP